MQFNVDVDAALLKRANAVREKTWPALVEQMLQAMVDAELDERHVAWGAGGSDPLQKIYKPRKSK